MQKYTILKVKTCKHTLSYRYTNNFCKDMALFKKYNLYTSKVDITLLIKNSSFDLFIW